MNTPYLSIVIPMYNEEQRIGTTLPKLLAYLAKQVYSREVILVDDGGKDDGIALAREMLQGKEDFRIVEYGANRGKGYALKKGIAVSLGQLVLFTDADLATPIEELDKLLPWLATNPEQPGGYQVVQGSRKMPGAVLEKRQPWLRENMGKVFTKLCNLIAQTNVTDATCGFKCYQGTVARELYALQQLSDWTFDAEVIFIARKRGYQIKEVPVRWHDERGTKVRLLRDSVRSMQGLLKIRLNYWQGLYQNQLTIPVTFEATKSAQLVESVPAFEEK